MEITSQTIEKVFAHHLPGREILQIEDRGIWIRHNFKITLDGDEIVHLKIDHDFPASEKEAFICGLLTENHLPSPSVVALDTSGELIPAPFIIQKHVGGTKLTQLRKRESGTELKAVYFSLGNFYKKLHSIHYLYSGWIDGPGVVYPRSPNEHQYDEVIVKIGQKAVDRGVLTAQDHQRLQWLWQANLAWLDQHQPSLVGGSLPWTIYFSKTEGDWQVTKWTDLEDFLYWDPAWDLTNILYPAFSARLSPEVWAAFQDGYGKIPSAKRMKLYLLIQRLDSGLGNYMEPGSDRNELWKQQVWKTFPQLLDEVENL